MRERLQQACRELLGADAGSCTWMRAPGRTNLIGEHTDYQGGLVLPVAVDRWVTICGVSRTGDTASIHSLNFNQSTEVPLREVSFRKDVFWANYVLGVIREFQKLGAKLSGFRMLVGGNIPIASGLSSSAALEICTAGFLMKLFQIGLPDLEVIRLARRAENEFVGVQCGIMDQFSSYLCRKDHALLLNCRTLEHRQVPLRIGANRFLLVDTRKERTLSGSVYNDRVRELNGAVDVLKQDSPVITCLGDANEELVRRHRTALGETVYRRALHVVRENARVIAAAEHLEQGDAEGFGKLLYESHESLRDLYEVSCPELDFIVDFCRGVRGVHGARLTGAGMGGCCLVFLEKGKLALLERELGPAYGKQFGRLPSFYNITTVDGARYQQDRDSLLVARES